MKAQNIDSRDFEGLVAEAIRLGRELAEAAQRAHLGATSVDVAFVGRCLAKLRERRPLGRELDGGLDAVGQILRKDLAREVLRIEETYIEVGYGADGPRYEVEEMPVYSERGGELLKIQQLYSRFQAARSLVLDHLAAQDVVLEMFER